MPELRLTIPAELDGQSVRQAAMKGLGMSNGLFKRAKFHGQVLLDGVPVLANAAVRQGQNLLLSFPEKENTAPAPVELGLRVAFEDEYLMMVDKPAPLPSASSPRQALPTLENAVYAYLGCPEDFVYRPVNRLDKGTSGLMLVAKTAYAQDQMQQLLHTDHFQREYLAVTEGRLPEKQGLRRHSEAGSRPGRQRSPHVVLGAAGGKQPQSGAASAGYGPYPSDPRPLKCAGLPHRRRFSLWDGIGGTAGPFRPAQLSLPFPAPGDRPMGGTGKRPEGDF